MIIGELETFGNDYQRLLGVYQAAHQLFKIRAEERAPLRHELSIFKS
jgi:hypothetical protein